MDASWIVPGGSLPPGVRAVVTTREGPGASCPPFGRFNLGMRSGDDPRVVAGNRRALREALGLANDPQWLQQVHGCEVELVSADRTPGSEEPRADAAVTREQGRALAILTADCLPVLFASADGAVVGAAHAGWRGLCGGVLEATLKAMAVAPAEVSAWLGPGIAQLSYEVGDEVRQAFLDRDGDAAGCFRATRPGHWLCDLPALARQRLIAAGVHRVTGGDFDTYSDARLYSYRREGPRSGRFASLIWRERG